MITLKIIKKSNQMVTKNTKKKIKKIKLKQKMTLIKLMKNLYLTFEGKFFKNKKILKILAVFQNLKFKY